MGNITNTRLPGGITNVNETNLFADLIEPDRTQFHTLFNDFDNYAATDWTVTATGSTTQAVTAGDGGWLLITNSASNNDEVEVQKNPGSFTLAAGNKAFFRARFKVSDATASAVVIGLQVVNTTPQTATDGIYFIKLLTSTSVAVVCRKNTTTGSTTATTIATMADDTFIELGWYYDGIGTVQYEVNGTVVGSLDGSSTYLPDATNMAPVMYLKNGAAAAKTMTVDYLYCQKAR